MQQSAADTKGRAKQGISGMKFGMGQAVPRFEDPRLLRGGGRYTDDINLPGQARGYVLRSPHAHARIRAIDTAAARAAPGVLAVYTGADWAADGLGYMPCMAAILIPLKRGDGQPIYVPERPPLVRDRARFVGDYVAFVVAETLDQAKDAAELIEVDYEPLPAVTDAAAAAAPDAPAVWDECGDNVCFVQRMGNKDKVDAIFDAADHVTAFDLPVSRLAQNPMETRAALGAYDRFNDRYTLYSGTQAPHDTRNFLAEHVMKLPIAKLRVVSPDMGGGFGLRGSVFPEHALVLWAAKKLGRPVKWVADRSEHFLADDQGRDCRLHVELALGRDGEFQAIRVSSLAALGAYAGFFGPAPTFGNMGGVAGVYRTPAIYAEVRGMFLNTVPTGPYRGAGRPEAALMIELAVERAARELGIDRVEIRRRNMIPPDAMPFQTGLSFVYDSGRFEENMDKALALADADGFAARKAESEKRGRLRGLGIANAIEQSASMFDEGAEIRFAQDGSATVLMGTHSHGQGHETVFRQLLADKLGLEMEQIRYVQGDTDAIRHGHGTFGSRSAGLAGGALALAADRIIEKGKLLTAQHFETAVEDIVFDDGIFAVGGTDKMLSLTALARMSYAYATLPPGMDTGLSAAATFSHKAPTFPNGCHVCEVEIDPETGTVTIDRYVVVDDVGTVMNPLLLKGQIQGGVVQGASQITLEQVRWEPGSGQLLTGSFMDYAMPRASDVPMIEVETNPVPTPTNPLGIKGAGEAGTVGGLPCVMIAVQDALWPLGIDKVDMPATPEKLWRALNGAWAA
jgi:carbon-monoxide dehydrogenase large subunit